MKKRPTQKYDENFVFPEYERDKNLEPLRKYRDMQRSVYELCCSTLEKAKHECVGNWASNSRFPDLSFILRKFGEHHYGSALDFGCGIGRLMKQMLKHFHRVDGADFYAPNLCYAYEELERYCGKLSGDRFRFFLTDGISCDIHGDTDIKYNLIYSTLVFQHICVYRLRRRILEDFFHLLDENGQCVVQMGYKWDNGIYWFDDRTDVPDTNSKYDVCIPNEKHLKLAIQDFKNIGFQGVQYSTRAKINIPNYHKEYIYFYLTKNA